MSASVARPGLFQRYHLTAEDAEHWLKRPITGDADRGEAAVLAALNNNDFEDARRRLEFDPELGKDFRTLVEDHMRAALSRADQLKSWRISVPLPVWDEYAKEARIHRRSIAECLAQAVRRDFEQRRSSRDPLAAVDDNVKAYHRAILQLQENVKTLVERLGSVQDLATRMARIEAALGVRR